MRRSRACRRRSISTSSTSAAIPTTQEGLAALKAKPPATDNWNGPYVKATANLNDPWGRPYVYVAPGKHNNEFDLSSNGPDGDAGNGADPPVKNW
ncbi:MAG: type II secretion system protein GspG [Rhizomicrobium sp.]